MSSLTAKNMHFSTATFLHFIIATDRENHALKNREMRVSLTDDKGDGTVNGAIFSRIQGNPKITGSRLVNQLGIGIRPVRREKNG